MIEPRAGIEKRSHTEPRATGGGAAAVGLAAGAADVDIQKRIEQFAGMVEGDPENELGGRVWEKVCHGCWREWVGIGTKVINELGLQMSSPHAQQVYDEHMVEFLQVER